MEMDVDIFANLQPSNQVAGTDIFANIENDESTRAHRAGKCTGVSSKDKPARTTTQRVGGFGLHELTVTAAQVKALLCGICKLVVREAILMHMDTAANLMPPVSTFFVPRVLKGGWNYFGQAKPCSVLFVDGSCGLSPRILFWTVLS